jgi:hypothetical protein
VDRKFYISFSEGYRNFSAVFAGKTVFPEMFEVILLNEYYEIFCRKFDVPKT